MARRAVFLDRDGTLNVEKGYIRQVEDLELIPGVAQAVRRLNDAGLLVILTTNQTGAARGFYDEAHIHALNDRVRTLLSEQAGARLDAIYYCPHLAKGVVAQYAIECECRKPQVGMIRQAQVDYGDLDVGGSFIVGDKASDVEFAHNAGCTGILVKTGYGHRVLEGKYQVMSVTPACVAESLVEATDWILSQLASSGPAADPATV
jgi:D-glycero-D-manno-heptose 1,7-bisphosphate phosphatase